MRLRYNLLETTLGASLADEAGPSSVTFASKLTAADGDIPTISGGDYLPLVIRGATLADSEIVYLTAYTSEATSGTVTRGMEGSSTAAHDSGAKVENNPSTQDFAGHVESVKYTGGNISLTSTAWAQVPSLPTIELPARAGDWIEVGLSGVMGTQVRDANFDLGTFVSSTLVNRVGGGTNGLVGWYCQGLSGVANTVQGSVLYELQSGDVSGGMVDLRIMYAVSASTKTFQATSGAPAIWWAKNLGDRGK